MLKFLKSLQRHQLDWLLLAALCSGATSAMELVVLRETGIASLLRPASGIVFIFTLCLGWRGALASVFGVIAGYLLSVQIGWPVVFKALLSPWAAAILIAGIGVQALLQVWLLRRFEATVGRSVHRLAGILVVAPLGCLISPTVSTLMLDQQNAITNMSVLRFWMVAYTGSMLGVTVIYPLAWMIDRRLRSETAGRGQRGLLLVVALMLIGTWLITYELLISSIAVERSGLAERFAGAGEALRDESEDIDLIAIGLQAVFRRDDVELEVFNELADELGRRNTSIAGMLLARELAPQEQADYEARRSLQLGMPVRVRAMSGGGMPVAGTIDRREIVIDQAAPASLETSMVGLALSTDSDANALLADARARAQARLGPPLRILRDERGHRLLAWAIPLRRAADQRPAYLLLLQRPGKLVEMAMAHAEALPRSAWVQLRDVSNGDNGELLFTGDEQGQEILMRADQTIPENEIRSRQQLQVGGRDWELLVALPTTAAFTYSAGWWFVQIVVQMLGAALASVLVVSVDRRETVREMERQVSVLSRRYLNFERTLSLPGAAHPSPSANNRDAVLLKAFEKNAFQQYYEPIVSLADGQILGFESLLRWPDAPFQIAIPEIIAWAERSHHVHELTLAALRQAIERIERWKAVDLQAPWISINVSPDDVVDVAFMEKLMDLFKRHPLARRQIKLEITEGVLVRDFKGVAQRLRWVRDQGMGISLDDFGTGYSSLSYLHQLPVDSIKIDRSFISSVDADPRVREIVQATVELAHRLKLDIVAEGVEEPQTAAYLRDIGCQSVQGWLYSKAQPAAVIDDWVLGGRRFEAPTLASL